jgi:hypothetical protein
MYSPGPWHPTSCHMIVPIAFDSERGYALGLALVTIHKKAAYGEEDSCC